MIRDFFGNKSLNEADHYFKALKSFEIDPNQDFLRARSRIGMGAATTYAQIYFANQKPYKRFRRELELHPVGQNAYNREHDVIIVLPPYAALSKRMIQGFLKQSMGLATSAGFGLVTHAQLNTDQVLLGAKRLYLLVEEKRKAKRKILLISFSYGSSFVRVMMDHMEREELSHVKGWVNVSGLLFGSPRFHCSDKSSLFNIISRSQRSFSSEQRYFHNTFDDKGLKLVHFLGLKNQSLTSQEIKHREFLKPWGPNDGLIPFAPYQKIPGPVVPLFDQGHGIDLSGIGTTFVRTLSSMVSTIPMKSPVTDFSVSRQDIL